MTGEITAIHRRNIERDQWFQRLRVVPVVEVSLVPFQGFHSPERVRRTFDEVSGRKIAEVVGGQIRQQGQSHVGGRGAMRNDGNGMLLIIIRRQPMVSRSNECLKESPGFPGDLAQKE